MEAQHIFAAQSGAFAGAALIGGVARLGAFVALPGSADSDPTGPVTLAHCAVNSSTLDDATIRFKDC